MKHFNYPVEVLIKGVRERPALWDKTLEIYKDREERKQAWEQIFRILEVHFDEMTRQEKRVIGDVIINKWTNIRDTFIKSLKNQSSKTGVRKYLYHEEMSFLLKVIPPEIIPEYEADLDEDPISSIVELKQEMTIDVSEGERNSMSTEIEVPREGRRKQRKFLEQSPEREPRRRKRSKKPETMNPEREESPKMDFVEMVDSQDPRIMNEDEAFFASLLPTVVKYSEEERLEFRIDVLAVMKSINQKRRRRWTDDADE